MSFNKVLEKTRLIAILRGVEPHEVLEISKVLVSCGFQIIEVTLNSKDAFKSIEILSSHYKNNDEIYIGAGTVVSNNELEKLNTINTQVIISPNTNTNIIKQTKNLNLISIPGFITPSEAYNAIDAGANCLKLFPFEKFGISYYKDIKVILPNIPIIVVGGVNENNIEQYLNSNIKYFGLGSSLYKKGISLDLLKKKANYFINIIKKYNDV